MKDVRNITLKVKGKGWTARISMDDAIVQHVGIQTMPSRIAEAVINILDQIPPSSINSLKINLEILDMTGSCDDTMKSSNTPKQT